MISSGHHPTTQMGYISQLMSMNTPTSLTSTKHTFIHGSIQPVLLVTTLTWLVVTLPSQVSVPTPPPLQGTSQPARLVTILTWQVWTPPLSSHTNGLLHISLAKNQRLNLGHYLPILADHHSHLAGYNSHLTCIDASTLLSSTEHVFIKGTRQRVPPISTQQGRLGTPLNIRQRK